VLVIHSSRTNVYENLAAEDALLSDAGLSEPVVMIYRNDDAIVIGKNQNPWKECAVEKLSGLGVKLARRVSGGGTVFHDPGNLNISCILPRDRYCRPDVLNIFVRGLAMTGIRAEVTGGTSLAVDGRKISGNAFCFRQNYVLHHGTILWNADLNKLKAALVPNLPDVITRAIASVPMPVINLSSLLPDRTVDYVLMCVIEALAEKWGGINTDGYSPFALAHYHQSLEKMQAWDWIYGATPDFNYETKSGKSISVHRGRIIDVNGDASAAEVGHPFNTHQ
jgi:lipoate---protein ligase